MLILDLKAAKVTVKEYEFDEKKMENVQSHLEKLVANNYYLNSDRSRAILIQVKDELKTPNIPFFPKEDERDEPGSTFVRYAEDHQTTEAPRSDEKNTYMLYSKDPTIWKVKCMVGRERHSAFCLMQKYVDLKALGTKLQIVSAFAIDHVKGFIYIEAEKQYDINEERQRKAVHRWECQKNQSIKSEAYGDAVRFYTGAMPILKVI
ncbi:unnamed protein product [Lactuca saligna]|uniref:NGN domain-containing protein n=1 Tax=Lactuca saligna TaxID=75948 RepID=A0AA36EDM4_LACSI|nr:unnamed protein product [Lactuca saligna]